MNRITGTHTLPDPLADLPTPDQLESLLDRASVTVGSADQSIDPGVYDTIAVTGGGDLTMDPGIYVVTGALTLSAGSLLGNGVTIYLACLDIRPRAAARARGSPRPAAASTWPPHPSPAPTRGWRCSLTGPTPHR